MYLCPSPLDDVEKFAEVLTVLLFSRPATSQNLTLQSYRPLPHTRFALDFQEQHDPRRLVREDVVRCIFNLRIRMIAHIREHNHDPFAPQEWRCEGDVDFRIALTSSGSGGGIGFTWEDAYAVLDAFAKQMLREGYHELLAWILVAEGARRVGGARIGMGDG
ncbi:MAG: hypothetical protein Q9224_006462 [Gallowayella concinna]